MLELKRTNAADSDFIELVRQLDAYLKVTDGDEHDFYDQYNQLSDIKYVIIAYADGAAIGCGAIKQFSEKEMEVKRMYTAPEKRGQGIASQILKALENWTQELGFEKCILETGLRQIEAVEFYKKNRYQVIPNYGQYVGVENSVCFEKDLNSNY